MEGQWRRLQPLWEQQETGMFCCATERAWAGECEKRESVCEKRVRYTQSLIMFNCGTAGGREEKKKETFAAQLTSFSSSLFTPRQLSLKKAKMLRRFLPCNYHQAIFSWISRLDPLENAALLAGFSKRRVTASDNYWGVFDDGVLAFTKAALMLV